MSDIKEQLAALNKTSKKSVALYHRFALSVGVSDSSLGVLYALSNAAVPCSQYGLCAEWAIPKQTINTTVNALQKKGLIRLSPAPGARNKKLLALTEEGRRFADKTVEALRQTELCALTELTAGERELYVRLNEKYNKILTEKLDALLSERE